MRNFYALGLCFLLVGCGVSAEQEVKARDSAIQWLKEYYEKYDFFYAPIGSGWKLDEIKPDGKNVIVRVDIPIMTTDVNAACPGQYEAVWEILEPAQTITVALLLNGSEIARAKCRRGGLPGLP